MQRQANVPDAWRILVSQDGDRVGIGADCIEAPYTENEHKNRRESSAGEFATRRKSIKPN